jgi:hypothetical protein
MQSFVRAPQPSQESQQQKQARESFEEPDMKDEKEHKSSKEPKEKIKPKPKEPEKKIEVPTDIYTLDETNNLIDKYKSGKIPDIKTREKMYKSIRFYVLKNKDVKKIRDVGFDNWLFMNHRKEVQEDDSWYDQYINRK